MYDLTLTSDGECAFEEALEPANANLALLYCFLILLGMGIVWRLLVFLDGKGYFDPLYANVVKFQRAMGFEVGFRLSCKIRKGCHTFCNMSSKM